MDRYLKEAEHRIQGILLDLEAETGRSIDCVNVDTRNFGNCRVEIFLEPSRAAAPASPPSAPATPTGAPPDRPSG